MADISTSKLRSTTFAYLRACSNLSEITLKDVREHLEENMKMSPGSLKGFKDSIREIVADFHSIQSSGAASTEEVSNCGDVTISVPEIRPSKKAKKSVCDTSLEPTTTASVSVSMNDQGRHIASNKYKYSNEESNIVMKVAKEYMETHGLTAKDVCVALRNVDEGGYRAPLQRLSLWKELHELLPSRSKVSLYDHVQAKLFKSAGPAAAAWTDKEVAQLKQFVEQHGTRWSYIGKLMGRFPDECKKVHERRSHERKLSGPFSVAEDRRLFVAVQKALELVPEDFVDDASHSKKHRLRPVSEVPDTNIPWEAVAIWMDKERSGLDYLRRWPRLKQHLLQQPLDADLIPSLSSSSSSGPVRRKRIHVDEDTQLSDDLIMLEQVEIREPEDESDINWSSIDRKCSFVNGKSCK